MSDVDRQRRGTGERETRLERERTEEGRGKGHDDKRVNGEGIREEWRLRGRREEQQRGNRRGKRGE